MSTFYNSHHIRITGSNGDANARYYQSSGHTAEFGRPQQTIVELVQARIWYTTPNVKTGINDEFVVVGTPAAGGGDTTYTVTVPQGLYSVSELEYVIHSDLRDQGATVSPYPLVNLTGISATGKVEIVLNYPNVKVTWGHQANMQTLLGFGAADSGPSASAPTSIYGSVRASLEPTKFYKIELSNVDHKSSVKTSNAVAAGNTRIIAEIPINVSPGSLIVYEPNMSMPMFIHQDTDIHAVLQLDDGSLATLDRDWSIILKVTHKYEKQHE